MLRLLRLASMTVLALALGLGAGDRPGFPFRLSSAQADDAVVSSDADDDKEDDSDSDKSDDDDKDKSASAETGVNKDDAAAAGPKTHKAERGPVKVEVKLSGALESERMTEVMLRPEEWSTFSVLEAVPLGAEVAEGDTLIKFDSEKLDKQIADAERDRKLAELSLKQADEEVALLERAAPMELSASQRANRIAEEDYERFLKRDRPLAEELANRSVKRSAEYLEYAQEELDQLQKMYDADDLTEETEEIILKRARRAVENAEFSHELSKQSRDETLDIELPRREEMMQRMTRDASLALARSEANVPLELSRSRLNLDKLRHGREVEEEKLADLRRDQQLMNLKSPAAGLVYYGGCDRGKWPEASSLGKQMRLGGAAPTNKVIVTVVDPRPLFVRVDVAEKDLQDVRAGVEGTAQPTGYPNDKFSASVAEVSVVPIADGKFDGRINIRMPSDGPRLVPGMTCDVTLVAYSKDDAITVPAAAVFGDEAEERYVFVVEDGGQPERRVVELGRKVGDKQEVLAGLDEGDEILAEKPKDE